MMGNVAVRKEALPVHAWKSAKGNENGRVVKMNSLPEWRQREMASERIVDAASKMKVAPLSRKEIDAWCDRLLSENIEKNNHSC